MRLSSHFERSEAESRNLFFNRFLHFGPLRGPPVEMTKAHILIIIGISLFLAENRGLRLQSEKKQDFFYFSIDVGLHM